MLSPHSRPISLSLALAKRVIGMTFSEFGRRIISNGSAGTDHGAAQPVFIFGEPVKQGVLGNPPDLPSSLDSNSVFRCNTISDRYMPQFCATGSVWILLISLQCCTRIINIYHLLKQQHVHCNGS